MGWIIDPLHSVQEYDEIDNFGVFSGNLFVAPEPGDYNSNGIVDAADYTIWRDTFGQVGVALPADGDGDGVITDGDYTVWKQHFGDMVGTGRTPISVPEPGTWLSITLVAIVGNLKRKYV